MRSRGWGGTPLAESQAGLGGSQQSLMENFWIEPKFGAMWKHWRHLLPLEQPIKNQITAETLYGSQAKYLNNWSLQYFGLFQVGNN